MSEQCFFNVNVHMNRLDLFQMQVLIQWVWGWVLGFCSYNKHPSAAPG